MRIISKFKDFYDTGMASGYDDHTTYVRSAVNLTYSQDFPNVVQSIISPDQSLRHSAGKLLKCCRYWGSMHDDWDISGFATFRELFNHHVRVEWQYVKIGIMDTIAICTLSAPYGTDKLKAFTFSVNDYTLVDIEKIVEYLPNTSNNRNEQDTIKGISQLLDFIAYTCTHAINTYLESVQQNTQCAIVGIVRPKSELLISVVPDQYLPNTNIVLWGDYPLYHFSPHKHIHPLLAFQAIEQWIGGVKSSQENTQQITNDVVMRDSKGFDDYSFKKTPGKIRRKHRTK